MPSVPPYSSTTTAMWWCSSRKVRSMEEILVVPVVNRAGVTSACREVWPRIRALEKSFSWTTPTMSSMVPW